MGMGMLYLPTMNWIPLQKAADILGVHRNTARRWGDEGKLKMKREKVFGFRTFDEDECKSIAKKIPPEWTRDHSKIDIAKKSLKK